MIASIDDILTFWFGELSSDGQVAPDVSARWWRKDRDFDALVRERYEPTHEAIVAGECEHWRETPRGLLAYVIVLDQFSRNMYRDTARAFASDSLALDAALQGIERDDPESLPAAMASFLIMPLMHSEDLAAQKRCCQVFDELAKKSEGTAAERFRGNHGFAVKHREIIERFGRFPHRNVILGRQATQEELEYLESGGTTF